MLPDAGFFLRPSETWLHTFGKWKALTETMEVYAGRKDLDSNQLIIERQLQPSFTAAVRFAIFKCERSAMSLRNLPA
jgi:hypothetical protein